MNVSSPCVKICQLDQRGICLGCFRSLDEIARWSRMTEHEKAQVTAALDERRKFFSTINQGKTE
ncbi:MAG TPA: DUF1289 domain-containing protein [Verrucomicrobiae bacterium]|jgi:predicted Fe-S protein YdhL (DUF1289 family)|nr:DUF1289 domain-containing protein [Verrucomicrobiae bacterium]